MVGKTEFSPPATEVRDLRFWPADADAARTLTGGEVEAFNRDGFVSHLPVFSGDEVVDLRAYIDDLVDQVVAAPDRRNSYSIITYQLVCERLYDLVTTPVLLDYAEDLLGPDIVCWGTHLFTKLPGDRMEVPLHQDAIYWPLTPARSVTAWLAIDDADPENAAMEFVPGSHAGGPLPHEEKPLDGSRVLKHQVIDPEQFGSRYVNQLAAGEASLHSDLMLHGSGANLSSRRRSGLTIRYTAAEVRPLPGSEWWASPTIHCRGTIPAHWPHRERPDGEHPERMAGITGDFDGNPAQAD